MEQDYLEKSGQIRQLASMPVDAFAKHLSDLHNTLDVAAPNLAPQIYATASNAVQYLNNKLPKGSQELPQDPAVSTSKAQQRNWLELHNLVNNPVKILDKINDGSLTNGQIDAIKSVYPDLHQEMSQKLIERLGKAKNDGQRLPYSKRIAISKFIGQPVDSTLSQQQMQAVIQSAAPRNPQQGNGSGKAKTANWLSEADKVTKLYETPVEAREIAQRNRK